MSRPDERAGTAHALFEAGDTIGDYEIVSRLNEGGMATLYLGRRVNAPPGDAPIAIKIIHEHLSEDWQFVRMFVDEALISVRLRHPNVVRVDELGEDDGLYFLAMEYVHGCSLAELLRTMGRRGRRMRPEIAVWIASQVAAGLHAAHRMTGHDGQLLGVIHRDVSPQNVLLSVDGEVKLLDFGIAKSRGRAERTETGVIKGKIRYMAPEQAIGRGMDHRLDIYALGIVLWESLTMRRYVEAKGDVELLKKVRRPDRVPPSFRADGIDPRVDDAVLAALEIDPADRPPDAQAFRALLERAVPPGTVGPPHVAELLRVFVGDRIEASARRLPAAVGDALALRARVPKALPGEDETVTERIDETERTTQLTIEAPADRGGGAVEEDGAIPPPAAPLGAIDAFDAPTDTDERSPRLAMGAHDPYDDEDGQTVMSSEHEMADLFDRMRADRAAAASTGPRAPAQVPEARPGHRAGARPPIATASDASSDARRPNVPAPSAPSAPASSAPGPASFAAPGTGSGPAPVAPVARAPASRAPEDAFAPPARPGSRAAPEPDPSLLRWVVTALVVTLVAFALGAGAAVAWVHLTG
ncbi:MAG TPA: protein kinase [Sandaracinaceae bacterium LLY-WYZ-13_1]|nr:protein kinase [Sandaracinaceae bacterium LLY-WYZ-13_1]